MLISLLDYSDSIHVAENISSPFDCCKTHPVGLFHRLKYVPLQKILTMSEILEILKYTLPSLVGVLIIFLFLRHYSGKEKEEAEIEFRKSLKDGTLALRLQAYERLILFLERINPNSLVLRLSDPAYTPFQLQSILVQTVRDEFDHNVAQQLYVSDQAWTLIKNSKEEIVRLINTAIVDLNENATANDYARIIINRWMETEKDPLAAARSQLKDEVKKMF